MALGRKDVTVTRTNGGADIFRLAGLFGDDNLIRHQGLVWWTGFVHQERIVNYRPTASHPLSRFASGRQNRGETPPSGPARWRCRRSRLRHQRESLLFGSAVLSRLGGQGCAGSASALVPWSVDEPHAAIDGPSQGEIVNLTDHRAEPSRRQPPSHIITPRTARICPDVGSAESG